MTPPSNPLAQSVKDRLRRVAADRKEDFNSLLARYAMERLLYRLTRTRHGKRFVLKGAMLFVLWLNRMHRPTRDLDLLGSGQIDEQTLRAIFADVCDARVTADGLDFDATSITIHAIRENQVYQGLRVKLQGLLGKARANVQIDVGIGDAITPDPVEAEFPTLLDLPAPRLKAYPHETVVAEKLNAMVQLAERNSRMKDFYDLWLMAKTFAFDGPVLTAAVRRTFDRRQTRLDVEPVCFTEAFARDASKQVQWHAFLLRERLSDAPSEFPQVMAEVSTFLHPIVSALAGHRDFPLRWQAGGPWQAG
jgi:predicted nucleotidyltransferase component of viral defense system